MLTENDISFFARNGYLLASGVVPEDGCEELIEETWKLLPSTWSRLDPDTWSGTVTDSCHSADLRFRGGHLKFQRGSYPARETYTRLFGSRSELGEIAHALLGHPLGPMRQRGLYAIAPSVERLLPPRVAHHIESHPAQIISLAYLVDVPAQAGGLWVWPGSHRDLYPAMGSKLEHVNTSRSKEVYDSWAKLQPIEVTGRRGDAVLIHHRLIHAPSVNLSRAIRFGFSCDYMREDYRLLCTQMPDTGLWADWPGVSRLPQQMLDGGPDVTLVPRAPDQRSGVSPADTGVVNKTDASAIARLREPGELWVVLSDSEAAARDNVLIPRGSNIVERGLRVVVNGETLASKSRNDFIGKSPVFDKVRIEVHDAPCMLWIKVIRIELPFDESRLVYQGKVRPGRSELVDLSA